MRFVLLGLAVAAIAVSAATLKPDITDNALAYANARSREFAKGDSGKIFGWRECVEMENSPKEVGFVCEGTRTIQIQSGPVVDVNYFCEFQFIRVDANWFRVDHQLCQ